MEDERRRLARELHDGALQSLTSLGVRIELCSELSQRKDFSALRGELARLKLDFDTSIADIKELMAEWRMPSLSGDRLRETIENYVLDFQGSTGIKVKLDLGALPDDRLCREHKVAIFRILQEALRNTSQHSGASRVRIGVNKEAANLRICVHDNGKGFDLHSAAANYPRQGLGLLGMCERAEALGGELEIDSRPGRGTRVTLILPAQDSEG